MTKKIRICFLLSNEASHDPRVLKEAESAAKNGFEGIILGYHYGHCDHLPRIEKRQDFKIIRKSFVPKIRLVDSLYRYWQKKIAFFQKTTSLSSGEKTDSLSGARPKSSGFFKRQFEALYQFITIFNYYRTMSKFHIKEGLKFKPDIVHANDLDTLYAGYVIKKKTEAKLVYDAHEIWTRQGMAAAKIIIWLFSICEWIYIRKIDALISVNETMVRELSRMYRLKIDVPIQVIFNAPKYQKTLLNQNVSQPIKILYQGGCFPGRGIEQLSLAARYLPAQTKIIIRALGSPEIMEEVRKIRAKYHLAGKLEIAAPVPQKEMIKFAQEADIGVIATQPWNINNIIALPNKFFEYMMAGLAIACSDFPEMRQIVQQNQNGVVFNPENPKSIARALTKLSKNKKILVSRQENSLRAAKVYNWQNQEKKLISLYRGLLE